MEDLQRINVKFYLQDPNSLSGDAAFRIFNTWITESSEEVLVDVADYNHVGHGPITLLMGHEANYSLDSDEGELGLLYARKQPQEGDLSSRLVGVLTAALNACRRLETAPGVGAQRFLSRHPLKDHGQRPAVCPQYRRRRKRTPSNARSHFKQAVCGRPIRSRAR